MLFNSEDRAHEDIYKKLLSDKVDLNLGYLRENVLAQMIVASKWCLCYFALPKEGSGNYEIGFLLSNKSKAIPLEVKSRPVKFPISIDRFGGGIRLNRFFVYLSAILFIVSCFSADRLDAEENSMKQRYLILAIASVLALTSCGGKSAKRETVENVIAAAKKDRGYDASYGTLDIYQHTASGVYATVRLSIDDSEDDLGFQCRVSMNFSSTEYFDSVVSTVMFYDSNSSPEGTAHISDGLKNWYVSQFHLTTDYGKENASGGYELLFEDNDYSSTVSTLDARSICQSAVVVALKALQNFISSNSLDLKAFLPNF